MSLSDWNPLNWLNASGSTRVDPEQQTLTATGESITIQAAGEGEKKVFSFSSVAYSGGLMQLPGKFRHPVVVDLATITISAKATPVFREHDPNRVVGQANVVNDGRQLTVQGTVINVNEHAREVLEGAQNGFQWQQSIGAALNAAKITLIKAGETLRANGKTFTGPVYFVQAAQLKEVSFVALGADEETSAALAASANQQEEGQMKFAEWLEANGWDINKMDANTLATLRATWKAETEGTGGDAGGKKGALSVQNNLNATGSGNDGASADGLLEMRQDRVRMRKIETLCAKYDGVNEITLDDGKKVDPIAHAIEAGWSEKDLEVYLLRASYPHAPAGHVSRELTGDKLTAVLGAAVLQASGYPEESLDKEYKDEVLQAAHSRYRGRMTLSELFIEAALANGYTGRHNMKANQQEILQAAFSSNEISGILSNTANKFIRIGFENVESAWRMIAALRSVSDFKEITTYSLTGDMKYEKVGPTGEIKHGKLGEETYGNKADTYARMLAITRTDFYNDDLGVLTTQPRQRLGRGAALKLNDVFWTEFLDNSSFFTSGRANYFDGAATVLQSSSLKTAVEKFRKQTDPDGQPLGVMPKFLLVPPELEVTADELFVSTNNNTGGAATETKVPNRNTFAGKYQPVVSSYLSNATYTGYSSTAWYLLADPMDMPVIEIALLNGQQMPTIEASETTFNTLGVQMRGYHDFGVRKQEYRGGVKSKGAA